MTTPAYATIYWDGDIIDSADGYDYDGGVIPISEDVDVRPSSTTNENTDEQHDEGNEKDDGIDNENVDNEAQIDNHGHCDFNDG
ncbi:hypothetical protein GH714_029597 [Hevea brasiliensis]|uniref:Uncharacterized protein n=1 Tax=Hevea brasiliensis TaxID=3981 RepID=A0A6A6LNX5_HEVBR|nr:hypothetical protein GH714_029597 [Hevea brasiliensis]